jgi:hypothetical protein
MVQTVTTAITGDLGAQYPDGMTLDNTVVATALATPGAIATGTTNGNTILIKVYDVDGAAYKTFLTGTAANTPTLALSQPSGATLTWDGGAIGGTTPAAGAFTTLSTTGNLTLGGYALRTVATTLTAAGTARSDALALTHEVNNITTAASGTGVVLPAGVAGMRIAVFNNGVNAVKVYAAGSDTIDGTAGSTGVTLTNALRCEYFCIAANTWLSAKLGATST